MKQTSIASYMHALERRLRLRGLADREALEEIRSHLLESAEEAVGRGVRKEDAELQALERFGSVPQIVRSFEEERNNDMQKIFLAVGAMAGLFLTYVDAQPHWDDAGIIAFGLLLVSGALALAGSRRPWLPALAVGIWLPLRYILLTPAHDFRMLVILLFPLAGAYAGWALRLGIRRTFHPA